jgi:beta-N-acetylhexosaminidase
MRFLRPALAVALTFVLLGLGVTIDGTALAVPPPPAEQRAAVPQECDSRGPEATDGVEPTLEQLIGQKLMVTMSGRKVSAALARRVRRGEVGGVILLSRNVTTRSALGKLTRKLQRTAANAGQPPLLIAIDQEGGSVRRVPWAPPTIPIPEIGRIGSTSLARAQGARTGAALRRLGINVDLAPVADIPRSTASFMLQQGRTFSSNANRTARLADAFASGLASRGVLATMKHFPGIGLATRNTDRFVDIIRVPKAALRPDLRPFRKAIANGIPMIMLSNATYTAYDRRNAAGWSRAIADRLLRDELGFDGVSITDSLNGTAHARGVTVKPLALRAARAGTDMILVTGSERSTSRLYAWLLAKARVGAIPLPRLRASLDRILALKERL